MNDDGISYHEYINRYYNDDNDTSYSNDHGSINDGI